MQHYIVERIALADGFAVATHFGLQQEAVFHQVMAVEDLGHFDFQLIGTDIGEETQAATVDPQHRHVMPRQGPRRAQQAAIAADHDDHVTDFAEHFAR